MATISDVAKRAGVSTYTVSAVLNRSAKVSPELTTRVMQAVTELDYTINFVARSLQTRKTETIGMLIPDIGNQTYAAVLKGVEDVCRNRNYSLLLSSSHNQQADQDRALLMYRAKQVDGILLFISGDESAAHSLLQKKVPVVCVARRPATLECDTVTSDHEMAARTVTANLIAHGHKRIALMVGRVAASVANDTIAGWKSALNDAGLEAEDRFSVDADWNPENACRQALELLHSQNPPTAFLTSNTAMVVGVLKAAKHLKRSVPDEVEVACTSDAEWLDVIHPPITAVAHSNYELGAKSAELLFKRIADPERPVEHLTLQPEVRIR